MPTKHTNTIILPSDGEPIEVKVLGIWELDDRIPITFNEVFTYEVKIATGETYRAELDLSRFEEPPQEPEIPKHKAEPGSGEWHDWRNYDTYQAAVAHRAEMTRRAEQWMMEVSRYVVKNCLSPADRARLADHNDHNAVVAAAVTPRVTKEHLAEVLRQTFPGQLAGDGYYGGTVSA